MTITMHKDTITHYIYNKMDNNVYTPAKLSYDFGEKIATITAGDNHTVVMTEMR